jgi:hypothetical protein
VERATANHRLLVADFDWAGWDFYPSQWNAGTLLINWEDHQLAGLVAIAAPGVSLCGEAGLKTAYWRKAVWKDANAFFGRAEPIGFARLDLESISAEIPPDFAGWAADATIAHIERLRAFLTDRPDELGTAEVADCLEWELETSLPGARERLQSEAETAWGESTFARRRSRLTFLRRLTVTQTLDALEQLTLLGLVYGFYRVVRESWAPEGVHVELSNVLMLPLGQFFLWLYGFAHLLLPIAFLGWLYLGRRRSFVFARNTLLLTALMSIAGYLTHAPQPIYGIHSTDSIPASALATMPALHLTVALSLAYLGFALTRGVVTRIAWAAYPLFVVLVLLQSDVRYPGATVAFSLAVVTVAVLVSRYLLPHVPVPKLRSMDRDSGNAHVRGGGARRLERETGNPAF